MKPSPIAIYPISANPPTNGHYDILVRLIEKFEKIYWVAAKNPTKQLLFSDEERLAMMRAYIDFYRMERVIVESFSGTIVRYAESKQAGFLVRGLRNSTDFQQEFELAMANRGIDQRIETICMFSTPSFSNMSSSVVRELAYLGEDISRYVIPPVEDMIRAKYKSLPELL